MSELDDLVTGAEIGRRLGISRERVRQLAGRDDFPVSLGRLGKARVWRWADIQRWAEHQPPGARARTPAATR